MINEIKVKSIVASITGFHNPLKHKGMTASEFLLSYIKRQSKFLVNKKEDDRAVLIVDVLYNWDKWIDYVLKNFRNTLCS